MGTIKTTNIETITGSGTLTLGQSGETISIPTNTTLGASGSAITIPSGATLTVPSGGLTGQNYPAFMVTRKTSQSISNSTDTKIQFNNEIVDTDSAFDSTTNYRFTVPSGKGGNYLIYLQVMTDMGAVSNYSNGYIRIKKNGTDLVTSQQTDARSGTLGQYVTLYSSAIVSLSATDYLEGFVVLSDASGSPSVYGENNDRPYTCMYGYRIGA